MSEENRIIAAGRHSSRTLRGYEGKRTEAAAHAEDVHSHLGPTQITEHTFTQPASHRHIYQQLSTIVSVGVTFLSIRRHPGSEFCKQEKQLTVTKADLLLKERTVSVRRKTQAARISWTDESSIVPS